ncbi:MAG: tripartite tricarboxylate transporter substrate binding protein [Comamonas sp.]
MNGLADGWKNRCLALTRRTIVIGAALGAAGSALAAYPDRPIILIVPFAPGGSSDIIARTIAPELSAKLGQSIVVENTAGAGGVLGMTRAVRSPADGYSLLLGSGSEVLINKLINPALQFDGLRDLKPVVFVGTGPMVLVGKKALAPNTVAELITYAKDEKNVLNFASAGNGTPMHVAGELFNLKAGTKISHIPYRGASPALVDVMGGQIELGISTLTAAQSFIKAGKIKAYGVLSREKSPLAPDIPAIGQVPGLEAVDLGVWFGLFVPGKTPADVTSKLEAAARAVMANPEIVRKLAEQGVIASGESAGKLNSFMAQEVDKYRAVIKAADIKPQ